MISRGYGRTCGKSSCLQMKVVKTVLWSTMTVPPPLKRLSTGMPSRLTASWCSSCSGLPEMPMTMVGDGCASL